MLHVTFFLLTPIAYVHLFIMGIPQHVFSLLSSIFTDYIGNSVTFLYVGILGNTCFLYAINHWQLLAPAGPGPSHYRLFVHWNWICVWASGLGRPRRREDILSLQEKSSWSASGVGHDTGMMPMA